MTALETATEAQLLEALQALRDRSPECTGVSAVWCPNHGDCTCTEDPNNGYRHNSNGEEAFDCPLHGSRSETHCAHYWRGDMGDLSAPVGYLKCRDCGALKPDGTPPEPYFPATPFRTTTPNDALPPRGFR